MRAAATTPIAPRCRRVAVPQTPERIWRGGMTLGSNSDAMTASAVRFSRSPAAAREFGSPFRFQSPACTDKRVCRLAHGRMIRSASITMRYRWMTVRQHQDTSSAPQGHPAPTQPRWLERAPGRSACQPLERTRVPLHRPSTWRGRGRRSLSSRRRAGSPSRISAIHSADGIDLQVDPAPQTLRIERRDELHDHVADRRHESTRRTGRWRSPLPRTRFPLSSVGRLPLISPRLPMRIRMGRPHDELRRRFLVESQHGTRAKIAVPLGTSFAE